MKLTTMLLLVLVCFPVFAWGSTVDIEEQGNLEFDNHTITALEFTFGLGLGYSFTS